MSNDDLLDDFVESFYDSPSVFRGDLIPCSECSAFVPRSDIDPNTGWCPKCKAEALDLGDSE